MNTFRALCAELLQPLAEYDSTNPYHEHRDLITRADAALAQPEPVGPTDEELLRTYGKAKRDYCYEGPIDDWPKQAERAATVHGLRLVLERWRDHAEATPLAKPEPVGPTRDELRAVATEFAARTPEGFALAVLARWGRPAIEPVPTSERPWEREGWCDAEGRCYGWDGDYWWMVGNPGWANVTITHWLPWHALPVPSANSNDKD